jgi:hypothetical protein
MKTSSWNASHPINTNHLNAKQAGYIHKNPIGAMTAS